MATKTKSKNKKSNGERFDAYQAVTDKIVAALEQNIVPWRKPWKTLAGTQHQNFISHKPYRGVNPFLLDLSAYLNGWSSPYWLTGKQVKEKGGEVPEKEWRSNGGPGSTLIVFFKPLVVKDDEASKAKGEDVFKTIPLLRWYSVWNIEQTTLEIPEVKDLPEFNPIEAAEKVIEEMPEDMPRPRHGGDRAFYDILKDKVQMPLREAFQTPEFYYSALFHEEVHATGHKDRLNRKGIVKMDSTFGSEPYAQEELVAQMGAAMICGTTGIDVPVEYDAGYIQNWLQALKNDKKLVVMAAAQAQKAADYILNVKHENGEA